MWNPSIEVTVPRLEVQENFDELCSHYHEFYKQYLTQFQVLASLVQHYHVKYGIEEALKKGITSSVKGRLILAVRLAPEYKLKHGEEGFSYQEKIAYDRDYYTEFTMTIEGNAGRYSACIGLKAMTKYGIMLAEIPNFSTNDFDKQEIPEWFITQVKAYLK